MSRLLLSLYLINHDSNISAYDVKTKETFHIKFERINNVKHYASNNYYEFTKFLKILSKERQYDYHDILDICHVRSPINAEELFNRTIKFERGDELSHHEGHQLSTSFNSGMVHDGQGSQKEFLTVFNKGLTQTRLYNSLNQFNLGFAYNQMFVDLGIQDENILTQSWQRANCYTVDIAGKVMAYDAYGELLPTWQKEFSDLNLRNLSSVGGVREFINVAKKWTDETDPFKLQASYIKNITYKVSQELLKILKMSFDTNDQFSFSGGVAQNLILNNEFKNNFPNMEVLPHVGDEGLSLGGLKYLTTKHGIEWDIKKIKNFPFIQSDEDMGYGNSKSIKEVAGRLAKGEIVLWCQGNGELGPRALGHRSILMNPAIANAKEQINQKVKNREWYRPYAASVKVDKYQEYFDLPWESPYMLYQAQVKDPIKFKSITHADGTCRIQTVYPGQYSFYELLDEFEKLTGFPILLNTSLNLPGSPIVGRSELAIELLKNSGADCLVIGNKIYEKNVNKEI